MGRAVGGGLSAPTIISKKPFMLLSLHPPCLFLSRHQPGSELIGRAPATQNIKQPGGRGGAATNPHSLPPTIRSQQPQQRRFVLHAWCLIRSSGRRHMEAVTLSGRTTHSGLTEGPFSPGCPSATAPPGFALKHTDPKSNRVKYVDNGSNM